MAENLERAVAVVGVGAILPDAPDVNAFWQNVERGRYCISEVSKERWDPDLYYDADPYAPDKTYSKIGGWVRDFEWDPLRWKLPIPPLVADAMDDAQKWAVALARAVLLDYGWPDRPLDQERTAVILGNAMAGENHYLTALRVNFPEFARDLEASSSFRQLAPAVRDAIIDEAHEQMAQRLPAITEDTMPGELANILAGRVANVFDLRGPNYVTDAACASGMAAMTGAIAGLVDGDFDAAITGGVDRNMGASTFVKFCKIGALSATGTRPYADGADGFVMGEGGAVMLLKRLADAERAGDRIYAVIRGIAGASDGKGKGITAPNPTGQRLCVERAWRQAGCSPASADYVEGHGTSTRVGDVVEVDALSEVFSAAGAGPGTIGLGSVKSNIGHLKGAAGAAGVLKTVLALHHKVIPPSLNAEIPNPNIDFSRSPLRVNTRRRDWEHGGDGPRRAGVSAFGFGGTNFHAVLEEYVPGMSGGDGNKFIAVGYEAPRTVDTAAKVPLRGALVLGAANDAALVDRLRTIVVEAEAGRAPEPAPPSRAALTAPVRLSIDYGDATELARKGSKAVQAFESGAPAMWRALRAQGVFVGRGPAPKVAFLYTGQGSQYVNMLQALRGREPLVAGVFAAADRVMTPLLGRPLTDFIFVDGTDPAAVAKLEEQLKQTEITQPAVLATDQALTALLDAYGIRPDMVMGHSLGEYGALVAADALDFEHALEAVSARGHEMASLHLDDNGAMAAVIGPIDEVQRVVDTVDGYVVVANVNSTSQAVVGGATSAIEDAIRRFADAGMTAMPIPVSHAFHTTIVAPASEPLRRTLARLGLRAPRIPLVANVDGEFYPTGPDAPAQMLDILARQVASPVQFVRGLQTLYAAGVRLFVEVGPKRALHGFTEDVLGDAHDDVVALFTNHPKSGDIVSFNQALCGCYAAGLGAAVGDGPVDDPAVARTVPPSEAQPVADATGNGDRLGSLRSLFDQFVEQGRVMLAAASEAPSDRRPLDAPVVVTGAALGLPGTERVFDDASIGRILGGEQFIGAIPPEYQQAILDKHITRLVKRADADPVFETIDRRDDVVKLAGRKGAFDIVDDFGVDADRAAALDIVTKLAIGAGLDALRDAGIPLVLDYRTTSIGSRLPDRWMLPEELRGETGVVFASAFPGLDAFAAELDRFWVDRGRREQLSTLQDVHTAMAPGEPATADVERRIAQLRERIEHDGYEFDRKFLFRVLAMGHSQFAEIVGARGPNTHVNSACAATTQAVAVAEDWIRHGRCRRVVIVAADDVTSDALIGWMGAGFLATGAAATDERVEDAALPFDRRRHGMILGMGAAAMVVESAAAARDRGIRPICEVLSTVTANSAFHGTRLDVTHIEHVMETLMCTAEARGIDRRDIAPKMVFVSHETYTPARGGSASAEINALRRVFGDAAPSIVIANTKGFTGHPMGVGVEDVVAVKALETGLVPPVANFREPDPEFVGLTLSEGGEYGIEYALRLAAGFGSQISMSLMRRVASPDGVRRAPDQLGFEYRIEDRDRWQAWLDRMSGHPGATLEVWKRRLRIVDAPVVPAEEREPVVPVMEREVVPEPEPEPV